MDLFFVCLKIQLHVNFESKLPKKILKKITEDEYSLLVDCKAAQKCYLNVKTRRHD